MTSALFGNNASSTWTFNPNVLYRLAALQTQGQGGTTIQNFAYTYDPVGNLTQIANTASTANGATVAYGYDSLNRLMSASTTAAAMAPFMQSFSRLKKRRSIGWHPEPRAMSFTTRRFARSPKV